MRKVELKLRGISCAGCVKRAEDGLKKMPGIVECQVNLATNIASVEYDANEISLPEIVDQLDSLGYPPVVTAHHYRIAGIHCASCVSKVEKGLTSLAGLVSVGLNPGDGILIIYTAGAAPELAQLEEAVNKFGTYKIYPESGVESGPEAQEKKEGRILKLKLITGALLSVIIFVFSMGRMIPGFPEINDIFNNYLLLILTIPVFFWVGWQFHLGFFRALKHKTADMNSLVSLGTSAAFFYSTVATVFPDFLTSEGVKSQVYFDTAAMIIVLILFGRNLESRAKRGAGDAIRKLMKLGAKEATVIKGKKHFLVPLEEVKAGDLVVVKSGEKVAVDGQIIEGETSIDESMVTGESIPVFKKEGDSVFGATVNTTGAITIRAEKVGSDSFLQQVIRMVQEAQGSKAPIQKLADKVAGIFVPVVLAIAVVTFLLWFFLVPEQKFLQAMLAFINVLIIACPCSLGLATPTAIMAGTGRGARMGILIKDAIGLERMGKIDHIVFDKTGTLTQGKPQITQVFASSDYSRERILSLAEGVERYSEHPLAKAVNDAFIETGQEQAQSGSYLAIPGKGASAEVDGKEVMVGSRNLMDERHIFNQEIFGQSDLLEEDGKTIVYVVSDGRIVGSLAIMDTLRKNSAAAIKDLQEQGLKVTLLSGDRKAPAQAIARSLGIKDVVSEVLPGDKTRVIKGLQEEGFTVAMVGDGINDSPALAQADVGIAIGSGTDIAMESSDIVLVKAEPLDVVASLKLSKATLRIIKQNLFWAFIYNIIALPLAAGILYPFTGLLLSPVIAAAAMAFSSVSVVSNSLRLNRLRL